jgi:hypothetical protein
VCVYRVRDLWCVLFVTSLTDVGTAERRLREVTITIGYGGIGIKHAGNVNTHSSWGSLICALQQQCICVCQCLHVGRYSYTIRNPTNKCALYGWYIMIFVFRFFTDLLLPKPRLFVRYNKVHRCVCQYRANLCRHHGIFNAIHQMNKSTWHTIRNRALILFSVVVINLFIVTLLVTNLSTKLL